MAKPEMADARIERLYSIDLLKGLACIMMLVGHAFRIGMAPPAPGEKLLLYLMDFSGPIFFFLSGMNVLTFVERNSRKKGFSATAFYLSSALALFFIGYIYNFSRGSLKYLDILQCVAVCTAFVYLMMRTNLSTWVHLLIIALLYLVYLDFRLFLELDLLIPDFTILRDAIPPAGTVQDKSLMALLVLVTQEMNVYYRWTFFYFGFLPWVVYFYLGAVYFHSIKTHPQSGRRWVLLFCAMIPAGLLAFRRIFPDLYLDSYLDLMVRGIPSYVGITLGGTGLIAYWAAKAYPGAQNLTNGLLRKAAARLETLGKESLLFLFSHWWIISTVMVFESAYLYIGKNHGWPMPLEPAWLRAGISIAATAFVVPWLARLRDRLMAQDRGIYRLLWFMGVNFVVAVFMLFTFLPLGLYLTYGVSIGLGILYPWVRRFLRDFFTAAKE